jgi:hypothetical protein
MSEQRPENDSSIEKIRRLITYLAVVIVILGQIFLFTMPLDTISSYQSPYGCAFLVS